MEEDSFVYTIFICVINSFSSYTAIMLNCVTIHAIRRTPSLPQTLKILLLSLAVSDLGVGLVVQPCYVAGHVMKLLKYTENDLVYETTMHVHIFSLVIFSTASFLCVVTLSLDRFLAINYCLRYKQLTTRKRVVGIVAAIWLFSIIISLKFLYIPLYTVVLISATTDAVFEITSTILNLMIYRAAKAHLNRLQSMELAISQPAPNASSGGEMVNVARVRRFAKLSMFVYLAFIICYLPQTCMLWIIGLAAEESSPLELQVNNFTDTLLYLNSSVNPLIYCLTVGSLRVTIKNMIQTLACWKPQPQPPWFDFVAGEATRSLKCKHSHTSKSSNEVLQCLRRRAVVVVRIFTMKVLCQLRKAF